MNWMLGLAALLAALVALGLWARASYRRDVRRQVLELLRQEHPEVTVVREATTELDLRFEDGSTGTIGLTNLYTGLAMNGQRTPDAQSEAIRVFVKGVLTAGAGVDAPLSLAAHGERLLPRLAVTDFAAEAARQGKPLVSRPAGVDGLLIVYVLDSEQAVMYLGEDRLGELGIDAEALHERAMANLRRQPIAAMVRDVVDRQQVTMVRLADSYDATRLLLVPEALGEGEELVAVIPDRETLGLLPVPAENAWPAVRKLARTPASPYRLVDRPLRVTRAGFAFA